MKHYSHLRYSQMSRAQQIAAAQLSTLTQEGTPTPSKRKAVLKKAIAKAEEGKCLAPREYRDAREAAGLVAVSAAGSDS